MKYRTLLVVLILINNQGFCQLKTGDKLGGVVKMPFTAAQRNINGKWDPADKTGNAYIDTRLNDIKIANKSNPRVITALENWAAKIKANPENFMNPDGSVNKQAVEGLISSGFPGTGDIVLPSNVVADSNTTKGRQNL